MLINHYTSALHHAGCRGFWETTDEMLKYDPPRTDLKFEIAIGIDNNENLSSFDKVEGQALFQLHISQSLFW